MPKQRHLSHVQIVIIVTEAWYLSNYGYRSIFAVMYTAIVNALEINTALPVKHSNEEMIFRLAETCPNMRLPKPPSYAYFTSSSCWAVVIYKSSHGLTADSFLRAVR